MTQTKKTRSKGFGSDGRSSESTPEEQLKGLETMFFLTTNYCSILIANLVAKSPESVSKALKKDIETAVASATQKIDGSVDFAGALNAAMEKRLKNWGC